MHGKKSTAPIWALIPLTLSALTGCAVSSGGADTARIDAVMQHVGPCAGALADGLAAESRAACLPVLVILDGAR